MNESKLRELITKHGLAGKAGEIVELSQPCIALKSTRDKENPPTVGSNKIGGAPDLPPETPWPDRDGRPLSFLAQIRLSDLATVQRGGLLPTDGMLWFFYDCENMPWGFDPRDKEGHRVLYAPDATVLSRRDTPEELEDEGWFLECWLEPQMSRSLPSDPPDFLSDDESDAWFDLAGEVASTESASKHQMLGYPEQIQNPMELECQLASNGLYCGDATGYNDSRAEQLAQGAADWRLLLQIDTDGGADMMWGDCGMLYFWVRKQDVATVDFEKSWLILQCF